MLWHMPDTKTIMETAWSVESDQCMYGLQAPGDPMGLRLRKCTRVVLNLSGVLHLVRVCDHSHEHRHCFGSVRTPNGWIDVAKAARR